MNRSPDKQHEVAPVRKPQPAAPQERRKASNLMEYLGDFDLDPPDNLERALPDGESDDEAGADLSHANLNGADLRSADLSYTTMESTYLGSAILTGAVMVDIRGCDDSLRLPDCYLD